MDEPPQVEFGPRSAVVISTIAVLNIIWWMVIIASIVLGAVYLNSCPLQPNIPIYLIVFGVASLLSLNLTYFSRRKDDGFTSTLIAGCMTLLHLFTFGWFIAGTSWVYPIYPPNYTPGAAPYCQKTTYQFAFILITVVWVILTLMFFCGGCFTLLTCCRTVTARSRLIPSRSSFYGATSNSQETAGGDV